MTNPYQSAKTGGIGGFFKGAGKGLLGAVASPFTATFKVASDVSQGISSSTIKLAGGRVQKQGRFRHPRYINPTGVLETYDESISEAQLVLISIRKGFYSDELVRYFARFYTYKKEQFKDQEFIFIITDRHVFCVKDLEHITFKCKIKCIETVEMLTDGMDVTTRNSIHHLKLKAKDKKVQNFSTDQYNDVSKALEILKV